MPSLSQIPRSLFTEHNKSMVYGKLKANEGRKRREVGLSRVMKSITAIHSDPSAMV